MYPEKTIKINELFASFSEKDLKEFKKLISSPLYSKGRNYKQLLDQILKASGKKNNASHLKKSLTQKSKNSLSQTFRNRLSELNKLAEEYLIHKTLNSNRIEKERLLLRAFFENKFSAKFKGRVAKMKDYLYSIPESELKYDCITSVTKMNFSLLKQNESINELYEPYYEYTTNATCGFLINLFIFGIEYIQQEQINRKYEFNIVPAVLSQLNLEEQIKYFTNSDNLLFKNVAMHYYLYKAFENPDEDSSYYCSRKIFMETSSCLSRDFKMSLHKDMTSYSILRLNQGVEKFRRELFKLYEEKLKLALYSEREEKVFPVTLFRNFVILGIMLKKTNWTKNFIKNYSNELPAANRDDEIRLSYSKLFFSSKDYGKSLEYLENFKGNDYLHYCDSSIMKLCSYYETRKFEEAFSEIDKFSHYLRNHNEIPKPNKEYFRNFLKVFQTLIKTKTKADVKNLFLLENKIDKLKFVSKRMWLCEKISELNVRRQTSDVRRET